LLTDRELEESIRDRLREDNRIDLEELRIVCRHGVVYLNGIVPSEAERNILLHLLTDTMGLPELVDRLRVADIVWEREERDKFEISQDPLPWEDPPGTSNLSESMEEDREFVAPTDPGPDEE